MYNRFKFLLYLLAVDFKNQPVFVLFLHFSINSEYASAAVHSNETDKFALLEFKSQMTKIFEESWPHGMASSISVCGLESHVANSLYGDIPQELGQLLRLQNLNLSHNFLGGEILVPPKLGSLLYLEKLYLKSNNLTGNTPASIGNLTFLQELYLSFNNLEGEVPDSISQLRHLRLIGWLVNSLSGVFPPSLYNLSLLQHIALSYNNFIVSLSNASYLQELDLPYNNFTGGVPMNLGSLQNLWWFNVRDNLLGRGGYDHYKGFIASITNCSMLQMIDSGLNQFGGMLSYSITNLSTQLTWLDFGGNMISGSIPTEIAKLINLDTLIMTNNFLTDHIPYSIGKLSNLIYLDLSKNQFSGNLLPHVGNLTTILDLYLFNNILERTIPSSLGNCVKLISMDISQNKFIGIIPNQLLSLPSISVLVNLSYNSLNGSLPAEVGNSTQLAIKVTNKHFPTSSLGNFYQKVSYEEILKATSGFASQNLIGSGNFETVYKGTLGSGDADTTVAVKFMPNGSLEEWLHLKGEHHRRRSLNPSNVLLDNDMTTRVSDFGLARVLSKFNNEANLNQFSSFGIKGTIGYAAPEYGMGGNVSVEGDLYSFGILLLEMFTSKRPTNEPFKDNFNLHNFVKHLLPDQVMGIVDQSALHKAAVGEATNSASCWNDIKSEEIECLISVFQSEVSVGSMRYYNQFGGMLPNSITNLSTQLTKLGFGGNMISGSIIPTEIANLANLDTLELGEDVYSYGILLSELFTGRRPADDLLKDNLNPSQLCQNGTAQSAMCKDSEKEASDVGYSIDLRSELSESV
ncbi:LRR receptor-like serine/threonine-protein kinase EFR [Camellia sinensis]|uniref:LRR receptor-like serine/threonine-protein kinase EFR n=1 Tax=Camellia sinensis TaxID=4442 RepID=UPI0010363676|nr:LRR receptor-like serine/threonine-protein kinase EFR [Camellia sinensis]